MPIYEYRCAVCGHQLEALQKMSDEPLSDCPACHAPELKKQISAVGFRLSGSGWYETDFKKGKMKNVTSTGSTDAASDNSAKKQTNSASATPSTASSGASGSQ